MCRCSTCYDSNYYLNRLFKLLAQNECDVMPMSSNRIVSISMPCSAHSCHSIAHQHQIHKKLSILWEAHQMTAACTRAKLIQSRIEWEKEAGAAVLFYFSIDSVNLLRQFILLGSNFSAGYCVCVFVYSLLFKFTLFVYKTFTTRIDFSNCSISVLCIWILSTNFSRSNGTKWRNACGGMRRNT